jgi:transcriptional regulator with XRE-family HTH domain
MANPLRPIMIQRRALLGLRQQDAAEKAGCAPGTWVRWESPVVLPRPGAWLKIAKVLGLTLEQLQQAAGKTLENLGSGKPQELDPKPDPKTAAFDEYPFVSVEAAILDRLLANIDLHKLTQGGWHYHMGHWRALLRAQLQALDLQWRGLRDQVELFQKLANILLGNETGRIVPLPKPPKLSGSPPPPKRHPAKPGSRGKKKR